MTRTLSKVLALFVLFIPAYSQHSRAVPIASSLKRHWAETDSETLWTVRYSNCDYGFYVLLDPGVVAHDTHPPAPNHGFLVSLSDLGKKSFASYETEKRFVSVDASYDVSDPPMSQTLSLFLRKRKANSGKGIYRTLAGLPAIEDSKSEPTSNGETFDQSIVAVRAGIVYRIGLHTQREFKVVDEKEYRQIVKGFKLLKLPIGECSNG
jgi:hypothetical protein